jgi:hypothetical protein
MVEQFQHLAYGRGNGPISNNPVVVNHLLHSREKQDMLVL